MSDIPAPAVIAPPRPGRPALLLSLAGLLTAALAGLLIGPAGIDPAGAIAALFDALPGVDLRHGLSDVERSVLFEIRLPRVVMGALVGSVLALAGTAYQGVFRNPLADP
ncbi:MAG: iron chelate uptake ABC transporter family permease subunit, partial [Acidimicrobiia bacterium]